MNTAKTATDRSGGLTSTEARDSSARSFSLNVYPPSNYEDVIPSGTSRRVIGGDDLSERFVRDVLPLIDQLYGAARRYTRSTVDAEDLVQDTLLRAYAGFHRYQDGTYLRAWLFRIMTNIWISAYRAARVRPDEIASEAINDAKMSAAGQQSALELRSAELVALEALGDDEVRSALCSLPEDQRMVVYYADVGGFRYKEISEILNVPVGTVMSRLHRGRRRLKTLLIEVARMRGYLRCGPPAPDNGVGADTGPYPDASASDNQRT